MGLGQFTASRLVVSTLGVPCGRFVPFTAPGAQKVPGAFFRLCSALAGVQCPDRSQHLGRHPRHLDTSPRRGRVDAVPISHVPDELGLQAHAGGHGCGRGGGTSPPGRHACVQNRPHTVN